MLFIQLSDMLRDKFKLDCYVSDSNARVNMLLFAGELQASWENDAAYFFPVGVALEAADWPRIVLAAYRDEAEKAALLDSHLSPGRNLVLIPEALQTPALNFAQSVLVRSLRESDNYAVFLRMIINGRDLSYVLGEATRQCGGQLVAIDFSGKIFACSPPGADLHPEWRSYIKRGYCPAEFMQHCYDILLKRTEISSRAYSYRCNENGLYYLSSPIVINNYAHGYIFLLSKDESTSPKAYETVQLMSRVAADYIRRSEPAQSSSAQLYRRLIKDILSGESRDAIAQRITAGKFDFPAQMRLLLVNPSWCDGDCDILKRLGTQLSAVFYSAPPVKYKNGLILLSDAGSIERGAASKTMDFLAGLAAGNSLRVGISNCFENIQDLPQYYGQACEAVSLSERLKLDSPLIFYSDVAFFSLVGHLSDGAHMRDFCHSALVILRNYDMDNGTELFETARIYVETNCNQKETAELLHTHRNTVSYRKQQIQQLTGVDFQDAEELFQLNYSFRIYSYLED